MQPAVSSIRSMFKCPFHALRNSAKRNERDAPDGAGYSGATQSLILSYLIGLYGLSGGNMYISSQSAPSGASRSFRFAELRNAWKGHLNMLRMLDTAGCTNSLIPAAPDKKSAAFIVVKGGC